MCIDRKWFRLLAACVCVCVRAGYLARVAVGKSTYKHTQMQRTAQCLRRRAPCTYLHTFHTFMKFDISFPRHMNIFVRQNRRAIVTTGNNWSWWYQVGVWHCFCFSLRFFALYVLCTINPISARLESNKRATRSDNLKKNEMKWNRLWLFMALWQSASVSVRAYCVWEAWCQRFNGGSLTFECVTMTRFRPMLNFGPNLIQIMDIFGTIRRQI